MITSIPPRSNSERGCGYNFLLFSSRTLARIFKDFDFDEQVFIRVVCNHLDSYRKMIFFKAHAVRNLSLAFLNGWNARVHG